MNVADWVVLLGTMVGIAAYGSWRTRHIRSLNTYLKGSQSTGWGTIGLSVMATQASAITFLSIPGQGFESGIGFVQNYFGLPLALIIVCACSCPCTGGSACTPPTSSSAGASTGRRACSARDCFCCSAASPPGVTIYAPAIILSTVLGWRLDLVIVFTGLLVIVYTVTGGSEAVSLTQKWQMAVIFGGMVTAFVVLLVKLPEGLGFSGAAHVAGALGKLQAVDLSFDPSRRYTLWTGLLGGLFLSLSYFGTDQSQVQRYIGGGSLREGRLGLMFNALLKIPMQFLILLLGALLFVFYQFERPPRVLQPVRVAASRARPGRPVHSSPSKSDMLSPSRETEKAIRAWLGARASEDAGVRERSPAPPWSRPTAGPRQSAPRPKPRSWPPIRAPRRRTPTTSSSPSSSPSFRTGRSACSSR